MAAGASPIVFMVEKLSVVRGRNFSHPRRAAGISPYRHSVGVVVPFAPAVRSRRSRSLRSSSSRTRCRLRSRAASRSSVPLSIALRPIDKKTRNTCI